MTPVLFGPVARQGALSHVYCFGTVSVKQKSKAEVFARAVAEHATDKRRTRDHKSGSLGLGNEKPMR